MRTTVNNTGRNFLAVAFALIIIIAGFKPVRAQNSHDMIALGTSTEMFLEELVESELPSVSEYVIEEDELQIEDWMSDDIYWGADIVEEENMNKPMPWMWCDYFWSGKMCEELINAPVELEGELHVEAWMYDNNYWK